MEVHQARMFLVLAEELHFGRAAQRLNMAQPPLSRAIKTLERTSGCELFTRSTRKVELTRAGQALVQPARELVKSSERADDLLHGVATGATGSVKIGFAGASAARVVGGLSRAVAKDHPGISLEFHSAQFSNHGLERVLDGSLDTALGRWDFLPPGVESVAIGEEEILAAVPEHHPLAQRESISVSELAGNRWILLPLGHTGGLQNRINMLTMNAGYMPSSHALIAPDSWTMLVMVEAGMGVAVTLDSVRDNIKIDGVAFLPLTDADTTIEVKLIWRRGNTNPALAQIIPVAKRLLAVPVAHSQVYHPRPVLRP